MQWWNELSPKERTIAVILGVVAGLGLLWLATRKGAASGNVASSPGQQSTAYSPNPDAVTAGNPLSNPFDFNITILPISPTSGQLPNGNPGAPGSSTGGGTDGAGDNAPGGTLGGSSGSILPPVITQNPDGSTTYSRGFTTGQGTPFMATTQTSPPYLSPALPPMGPAPPIPSLPSVSDAPAPMGVPLNTLSPGPAIPPSAYGVAIPVPAQPGTVWPSDNAYLANPASAIYTPIGVPNIATSENIQAAGGMSPDQPLSPLVQGSVLTSPENIPI